MPATKSTDRRGTSDKVFTADERAAMRERAKEEKVQRSLEEAAAEVHAKIAELPEPDRALAQRLHELITSAAPHLNPRTYYGMPAYTRDGKVVCFFKPASKFKDRYATLGFEQEAHLDDGAMWPTSYAVTRLTKADEDRIVALVKQAAS